MAIVSEKGVVDETAIEVYVNATDTDAPINLWVRNTGRCVVSAADEKRGPVGLERWDPGGVFVQRLLVPAGGRIQLVCGKEAVSPRLADDDPFGCRFDWELR